MPDRPEYSSPALQVASDSTFATDGDAYDGEPVIETPMLSTLKQGMRPGRQYPGQYENYVKRENAKILAALIEDRAALERFVGQLQVMNWKRRTSISSSSGSDLDIETDAYALYDPTERQWWIFNTSVDKGFTTYDRGEFISTTGASIPSNSETCQGADHDGAGTIIYSTNSRYVYKRSSGSWSQVDVGGSAITSVQSTITYDPVVGLWLWGANTATGYVRKTSPDGTTWTSRTGMLVFAGSHVAAACKRTTGVTVIVEAPTSSNPLSVYRSTNGGVTVPSPTSLGPTASWGGALTLDYDDQKDQWVLSAVVSGGSASYVWRSADDGITWDLVSTITSTTLTSVRAIGDLWVGLATEQAVAYSIDRGTTWRYAGIRTPTSPYLFGGLFKGAGGFCMTSTGDLWFSAAAGLPDIGVLT